MPLDLTFAQVQTLAPDGSALAAARKLGKPAPWTDLGHDDEALWGQCKGSAVYQTIVERRALETKCSCPSRKFPCKHALGLLLLASESPAALPAGAAPEWVTSWLAKRADAAQRKAARAESSAAKPVDEVAQAKRAAKRLSSTLAGLDQLDAWMEDLVRQGLARLPAEPSSFWDGQARRLVDAQAPGLASRVRRIGEQVGAGPDWAARVLGALGELAWLSHAFRRLDALEPALAADVKRLVGISLDQAQVIAAGDVVDDTWTVLGAVTEREESLRVRRAWLRGATSDRRALVLQFAVGTARMADPLLELTTFRGRLAFWPSAAPQRALVASRDEETRPCERAPIGETIAEALARFAATLARLPWIEEGAMVLRDVVPTTELSDEHTTLRLRDDSGASLPLRRGSHDRLLAVSGGRPVTLVGEWDGRTLLPLVAWSEDRPSPLLRSEA